MTTKADWDRNESLRTKLADILNEEPLKQALEVCLSMETDIPNHFVGAVDILHQAALSGSAREGYFRFYRNLKALTKEPTKPLGFSEPWGHVKPTNQK
jgi:hypothetical protein